MLHEIIALIFAVMLAPTRSYNNFLNWMCLLWSVTIHQRVGAFYTPSANIRLQLCWQDMKGHGVLLRPLITERFLTFT